MGSRVNYLLNSNSKHEAKKPAESDQLLDAQRKILQARDQIIGLTAQLAERDHLLLVARKNNKILRQELKTISSSSTWKLGNILMTPVRVLRRLFMKNR